jgi:hypothetical protein
MHVSTHSMGWVSSFWVETKHPPNWPIEHGYPVSNPHKTRPGTQLRTKPNPYFSSGPNQGKISTSCFSFVCPLFHRASNSLSSPVPNKLQVPIQIQIRLAQWGKVQFQIQVLNTIQIQIILYLNKTTTTQIKPRNQELCTDGVAETVGRRLGGDRSTTRSWNAGFGALGQRGRPSGVANGGVRRQGGRCPVVRFGTGSWLASRAVCSGVRVCEA